MHVDVHSFHVERTIFDVYDALHVYVEVHICTYTSFFERIRRFAIVVYVVLVHVYEHVYEKVLHVYVHICTYTSCTYTCTCALLRRFCLRIRRFLHVYVKFSTLYVKKTVHVYIRRKKRRIRARRSTS